MVRRTAILSIGLKLAFNTPYGPFSLKPGSVNLTGQQGTKIYYSVQANRRVGSVFRRCYSGRRYPLLPGGPPLGFSAPVVGNDIDSFPLQPPPFPRNLLCPLPVNVHIWMLEDNGAVSIVDSISRCSRSE